MENKILFEMIGSPFFDCNGKSYTDEELESVYDTAFENRVGLLYLSLNRSEGWSKSLEERYLNLKRRETMTLSVISELARVLNERFRGQFAIFKSIKPYPAVPNDTDVIFFGSKRDYKKAYHYLFERGYMFHEWAPLQKTIYDPRGISKIGKHKKGGTYYIDFYEEISTDYFSYLNKNKLEKHVVHKELNGVRIPTISLESELAIVLFHNVFPERTFQLEHFYLPLYYLSKDNFQIDKFVEFIEENYMTLAIKSNFSLIASLHREVFGNVPEEVNYILDRFGVNKRETDRLKKNDFYTPYLFTNKTYWTAFLEKSKELFCLKSLGVQAIKMINPIFFWEVVKSIKLRCTGRGNYHLEK